MSSDQNGDEITSVYDANTGVLKSATDSTGTTTYTYNSDNNAIIGVTQNGRAVSYSYNDTTTVSRASLTVALATPLATIVLEIVQALR